MPAVTVRATDLSTKGNCSIGNAHTRLTALLLPAGDHVDRTSLSCTTWYTGTRIGHQRHDLHPGTKQRHDRQCSELSLWVCCSCTLFRSFYVHSLSAGGESKRRRYLSRSYMPNAAECSIVAGLKALRHVLLAHTLSKSNQHPTPPMHKRPDSHLVISRSSLRATAPNAP